MIYLINQTLADRDMDTCLESKAKSEIEQATRHEEQEPDGWLKSALDADTAEFFSDVFDLQLPAIDATYFQNATPDSVPITLADNLDLGDSVYALCADPYGYNVYVYEEFGD